MKKLLLLTIMVSLSIGLFANGKDDSSSDGTNGEKITITMNIWDAARDWENEPRTKYVMEKFNVDFKFIPFTLNDWSEKLTIWVASGDMPDVMNVQLKTFDWPQYIDWIDAGAVRAYPDDLSPYPALASIMDSMGTDDTIKIDGKMYVMPRTRDLRPTEDDPELKIWSGVDMLYRRDWAKEVGLYKEGDAYTWEEVVEMGKVFMEKDPGGNGTGKTIGMTMVAWGLNQGFYGITQDFVYFSGFGVGYYKKDGKYVWAAAQPEMLDAMVEGWKTVQSGIIWSDQLAAKGKAGLQRYAAGESGLVFSYFGASQVSDMRQDMMGTLGLTLEEVRDATAMIHVIRDDGSYHVNPTEDYWSGIMLSGAVDDEKMTRWLEMLDWGATVEGWAVRNYGLEGMHWEMGSNGLPKRTAPFNEETRQYELLEGDFDVPVIEPFRFWMQSYDMITFDSATSQKNMFFKVGEDVATYHSQLKGNVTTEPRDLDMLFFGGENYLEHGALKTPVIDKLTELIFSVDTEQELREEWNKFINEKSPVIQPILDEINASLAD